jgi:hypothetical protein
MTKKESVYKKIIELAGNNETVSLSMTLKQLEEVYQNLMAGPALPPRVVEPLKIKVTTVGELDPESVKKYPMTTKEAYPPKPILPGTVKTRMAIAKAKMDSEDPQVKEEGRKDVEDLHKDLRSQKPPVW